MKLYQHKTPAVLSAAMATQYNFVYEIFYGHTTNEYRPFDFEIDLVLYKRPWVIT
jgi:hypothetical protein